MPDIAPAVKRWGSARGHIARDLATLIDGEVRFGDHDRMLYATDASIYQVEPIGVVVPRTIADIEAVVRYAARHQLPILPRGAGTSLAGQTVNDAIVIDFSVHLDQLHQIDRAEATVRVQPGVVLDRLNAAVAPHGLMFGPDVATSTHANLGGMIGNNSAGAHSILYGRTVDHVIGLDVLLADGTRLWLDEGAAERDKRAAELTRRVAGVVRPLAGEIERRFPKTLRRVNGYNLDLVLDELKRSTPGTFDRVNLAHLLCGSEGTLGVVVGAKLRLVGLPPVKGLALVAFEDLIAALDSVRPILATKPAAVELIDETVISLARRNTEYRRYVDLLPDPNGRRLAAVLYVEYFADDPDALERSLSALAEAVAPARIARYTDPAAMAAAWKLRQAGEPLLYGAPGMRKPVTFIEDTAVDPSRLPEFVAAFDRIVTDHGTKAAYYAHASVGCLHMRPMIDLHDPEDVAVMQSIASEVTELVKRFGGALSGEHGDGRLRTPLLERFYGKAICEGFLAIKGIFDPEGRLNPGNIVGARPMTEALRASPAGRPVRVEPVKTFFRYRREHGLEFAV
ncbi:MAG: FAD-binding oxidoreductase, partial [Planctomycetota bacterium]